MRGCLSRLNIYLQLSFKLIQASVNNKESISMQRTRILSSTVYALLFLILVVLVPTQALAQIDGNSVVKVMTYNVNEGTDFLEVLSAQSLPEFLQAVQTTLNNIDSTNPPLRMQAVANQIAQTRPDLVGLQEVTTWSVGGEVRYDMLQELLSALNRLGQQYVPILIANEFVLEAPLPDMVTIVKGEDHDVILARVTGTHMEFSNVQHGSFNILLPVPTPAGVLTIVRGWGAVDVTLHGKTFRFVVSHLETFSSAYPITLHIQEAQAQELLMGPAGTTLPVIIAVDANADALANDESVATYELIRSFGFGDAWAAVHPNIAGATWGFMPDPNDTRPPIHQRIDYIFFNNGCRALTAQLAGQRAEEMVDGLWPSDHAGVRSTLLMTLN